jgi:DNA-3-methyladenine glycosylase II
MAAKGQSQHALAIGRTRGLPLTFKSPLIESEADIARGAEFLVAREPCFAKVIAVHGLPSPRRVENNLQNLLKIVTEQLISLKAADAIWQRIETCLHPFEPGEILKRNVDDLRNLGLTRAKARSFHAIAEAIQSGVLNFESLHQVPDRGVLDKLVALPGIGPWTADIYLLSALGRADACPAGDLALQVAAQDLFAMKDRPTPKDFLTKAENWKPWRSVAARLLWSHYRGLKGLSQRVN